MRIYSFGFRHATPYRHIDGALVIDARRVLRNPYRNRKLRGLRGDDPAVVKVLSRSPGLEIAYHAMLKRVQAHGGPVFVGCTGGHHRSVYIANRLAKDLGTTA